MDLTQSLETAGPTGPTEDLLVTNVAYEIEEVGHTVDTPVFHLSGRRADGTPRRVEVEGFRPYLGIRLRDLLENLTTITNDRRVLGVETDCSPKYWADVVGLDDEAVDAGTYDGDDVAAHVTAHCGADVYHDDDPFATIHDEPVALVYARVPGDIGGDNSLRSDLDIDTYEADIPFERRFAITTELYQGCRVPTDSDRIRYENWPGEPDIGTATGDADRDVQQDLAPTEPPDVDARMIVYDIEVSTDGAGFPDPARAQEPITAISAYDSYDDTYRCWGLVHDEWMHEIDDVRDRVLTECADADDFPDQSSRGPDLDAVELFTSEQTMLESFHTWVLERNPDIFTGWNAGGQGGGFDTPYLIQRSYVVQARSIREYGDTGTPATWVEERDGERKHDFILHDHVTLDLLDAYKKTQFRELDSYKLDAVAHAELGYGKTGLAGDELDEYWAHSPVEFFTYSIRDTQATAEIESAVGLLDLFENLRQVTGASFETAVNNGPMLDTLFLRRAYEKGLVLPSNTEPDENVYHGAKVFDAMPGKHTNCVYPDLSSMYPNLFAMLNLGSETIIGDEQALAESAYTPDDCYQFPVDERSFAQVPKGESIDHIDRDQYKGVKTPDGGLREMFEPQYDWLYVLKPDVKESFVRDTVDELIDLKNQYSGQMYSAVKRVVNSVYGVAGDSASAGLGFRLYDRQVAEGITLAGRLTITHTAEAFTGYLQDNYDEEAYLVGGDTDSSVTSIPNAPSLEDAWDWSREAVEYVDESYDEFAQETFEMPADDHRLEVELESLASALFYMEGDDEVTYRTGDDGWVVKEHEEQAVKKRYAQHLVWNDSTGWLDTEDPPRDEDDDGYEGALLDTEDRSALKREQAVTYDTYDAGGPLSGLEPQGNVAIKGFEYVRSDSAQVTRDAQLQLLTDILLADEPRDRIEPYLRELVDDIEAGEVPLDKLARPKGIGQHLDDYGWKDVEELPDADVTDEIEQQGGRWRQTPGPTYRGAKYADDKFDWEQLEEGGKPRKVPISAVRCDDYPAAYTYEKYPVDDDRPRSPEVNDPVDALAVENLDRIPDCFEIDYDTIIQKELEEKCEDILTTIDLEWDEALAETTQTGLDAFA